MTIDGLWNKLQQIGNDIDCMKQDIDLMKQILVEVYDEPNNAISVESVQDGE